MKNPLYLTIAIPSPLRQSFDYLPPIDCDEDISEWPAGIRINVPFGRRDVVGILLGISTTTTIPENKLKHAIARLDKKPLFSVSLLKLAEWASQYYHYPLGEVFAHILPKALRTTKPLPKSRKKIPAQNLNKNLENELNEKSTISTNSDSHFGDSQKKLNSELAAVIEIPASPLILNAEQEQAIQTICASENFQPFLLDGITGSGKTEVYFHCIAQQLAQHKQALVLVPEIGLTPQTIERFQQRFPVKMALLHSGLTDRERAIAWLQAGTGEAEIIIGTRSAILTPLANPGIIILDEEHDPSFKQQSGLRYSARDMAIIRAQLEKIPIILGSATPSLETLFNCQRQRYQHLKLRQRAGTAKPPQIGLIDLREHRVQNGLTKPLNEKIQQHLNQNGQVLLFLNRRGYVPVLFCHNCNWIAPCKHCDTRLTFHLSTQCLFCHQCGARYPLPKICGQCKQTQLVYVGQGTERLEETICQLFPDSKVIRIDRDSTRRKGSMEALLEQMHSEEAQILIGTQMIAKGHHFSRLTLVAIIDADAGLFSSDFRSLERMAQLLVQVAGRAGRSEFPGEVVIQTHQPQHPMLQILLQKGYGAFAEALLTERQQAQLPPFYYFALLRSDATSREQAHAFLQHAKECLLQTQSHLNGKNGNTKIEILGPIPAGMERRANRYHAQLLIQSPQRQSLHQLLANAYPKLTQTPKANKVRWSIDIDPQEMF